MKNFLYTFFISFLAILCISSCTDEQESQENYSLDKVNFLIIDNPDDYWEQLICADSLKCFTIKKEQDNYCVIMEQYGDLEFRMELDNIKRPIAINSDYFDTFIKYQNDTAFINTVYNDIMYVDTLLTDSNDLNLLSRGLQWSKTREFLMKWYEERINPLLTPKNISDFNAAFSLFCDLVNYLRSTDGMGTYEQLEYIIDRYENIDAYILSQFSSLTNKYGFSIPEYFFEMILSKLKKKNEAFKDKPKYDIAIDAKNAQYNYNGTATCIVDGHIEIKNIDIEYGVCYSTSSNPSIEDLVVAKEISASPNDSYCIKLSEQNTVTLNGLKKNTRYYYRAYYKLLNDNKVIYNELIKEFSTGNVDCSISISDFKVTKSRYKEGAFSNNGKKYNFRFDTSLTATLDTEDPSYIKEWGFVYQDPDGNTKEIPLSGTKQIVTEYAYFRNSAHETAILYGYAYIIGNDKPIYGEKHVFPLNHDMAEVSTGDCTKVTEKSATVQCCYTNIPEGAICGVQYKINNESWYKQEGNSENGLQTITINGLKSNTKYYYQAFINDDGQMYYGGEREFSTKFEIPDLSGNWSCTIYNADGSILNKCSFIFTFDHKVTQKSSNWIEEGIIGNWSIDSDGKVRVSFSWTGGSWSHPIWYAETYNGQANSISNPSTIEGTVYRAWAGTMSEHGDTYRFKMTR